MAESKYIARVPVVPDDFENTDSHKNHELVMDFEKDDIYVKKDDGYVNITGQIKEEVEEIVKTSAVINVVTEESLPPISERKLNNWYWVITKSISTIGKNIPIDNYVYYGLIKTDEGSKNYLLIAQNMSSSDDTIPVTIVEGYSPCFYVPINFSASFKNHDTGEDIDYTIEERIYALNAAIGNYVSYDVYCLKLYEPGEYNIDLYLVGNDHFTVSFDSNNPSIKGLILHNPLLVRDGDVINNVEDPIEDPIWDDPRYIFEGWSSNKESKDIVNLNSLQPESDMTLYAWFEYNDDPNLLTYFANYKSSSELK